MIERIQLPTALADFGDAAIAAGMIVAYLVIAEPYVGFVLHRRFEAAARRFSDARRWLYRRLLLLEWVLAALCVAVVVIAPHVDMATIGVRLPEGAVAIGVTVLAVGVAAVMLALTVRFVVRTDGVTQLPGGQSVLAMLPRSPVERRLFSIVSVSAGICEELIYRGFLIAFLAAVLPTVPLWICVLIAAVVFGVAHAYQGAVGVSTTLLVGFILGVLYLLTGSLLAPILVHALVDLRAIPLGRLLAPAAKRR
ncbi:MAG: CPBP family intramembrane glutamic endopeptidase [Cumulibacter sp.]